MDHVVIGGQAPQAELRQHRWRQRCAVDRPASKGFGNLVGRHNDCSHAEFLEGRCFSRVVCTNFQPLQIVQGCNGLARVDTVRFDGEGRDYEKSSYPLRAFAAMVRV